MLADLVFYLWTLIILCANRLDGLSIDLGGSLCWHIWKHYIYENVTTAPNIITQ